MDADATGKVELEIDGQHLSADVDHKLTPLDSGWVERFERLKRRFGPWELARLEAILRLAEDRIAATALCAIHGQGHQNFLERLVALGNPKEAPEEASDKIAEALFSSWSYLDIGLTFRWDPKEDRRYALGFADPSGEKIRTVWGANRLAVAGFPTFATSPMGRFLRTTAFQRDGRKTLLTWPIWTPGLSLAAIQMLLNHPALLSDTAVADLSPYGVVEVMRARRIQTGKYLSFGPARALKGVTGQVGAELPASA